MLVVISELAKLAIMAGISGVTVSALLKRHLRKTKEIQKAAERDRRIIELENELCMRDRPFREHKKDGGIPGGFYPPNSGNPPGGVQPDPAPQDMERVYPGRSLEAMLFAQQSYLVDIINRNTEVIPKTEIRYVYIQKKKGKK